MEIQDAYDYFHNQVDDFISGVQFPQNSVINCSNCLEFKEHMEKQQNLLESMKLESRNNEMKFKTELNSVMSKLVDAEVSLIEKEKQLSDSTNCVDGLRKQLFIAEEQLKIQRDNSRLLIELQDRLDVLGPQAERAESLESQLGRLRERLEEQAGLKQQLKEESAAHAQTHKDYVAAENELILLRKLKPQLDLCRAALAEVQIEADAQKSLLCQRDTEIKSLKESLMTLSGDQSGGVEQTQLLTAELLAAQERIRELQRGVGMGEGVSELNPVLMNELHSLRSENSRLLELLDSSSVESLDRIRSDLEQQRCINDSLQKKWLFSDQQLSEARLNLATLSCLLEQERDINRAIQSQLREVSQMAAAETESLNQEFQSSTSLLKASAANELSALEASKNAAIDVLICDYDAAQKQLAITTNELESLQSLHEKVTLDYSILETTLEEDTKSWAAEKADINAKFQEAIQRHEDELLEETARSAALAADADGERSRRRRLERERRLLDQELHRARAQLQVSASGNCGGGQEVEAALAELHRMQTQLDQANATIMELRSAGQGQVSSVPVDAEGNGQKCHQQSLMRGPSRNLNQLRSLVDERGEVFGAAILQQADFSERRLEQAQKEKRELIARGLEENKERMELAQRLLVSEKEAASLRSRLTRATLELERAERKLAKATTGTSSETDRENIENCSI